MAYHNFFSVDHQMHFSENFSSIVTCLKNFTSIICYMFPVSGTSAPQTDAQTSSELQQALRRIASLEEKVSNYEPMDENGIKLEIMQNMKACSS